MYGNWLLDLSNNILFNWGTDSKSASNTSSTSPAFPLAHTNTSYGISVVFYEPSVNSYALMITAKQTNGFTVKAGAAKFQTIIFTTIGY